MNRQLEILQHRAEEGDAWAQKQLSDYESGNTATDKRYKAVYRNERYVEWLQARAAAGYMKEQMELAARYCEDGALDEAIHWYLQAAEQGNDKAQVWLGFHFETNEDYGKAVRWYRLAAERGNSEAQYYSGRCHYNGAGVGQEHDTAIGW